MMAMKKSFTTQAALLCTLALAALGLAACAPAAVPIAQSSQADAAKVRFIDRTGSDTAWIRLYPQTDCNKGALVIDSSRAGRMASAQAPLRADMLAVVDPTDSTVAEYAFAAGQRINVGASVPRVPHHLSCVGGTSFIAKPSVQYEVVLANSPTGQCRLEVNTLEAAQPAGVVARRPVRELQQFACAGTGR